MIYHPGEEKISYHYYGDRIRGLFMVSGALMVVTLPFFSSLIRIPVTVSLVSVLLLAVLAGFLNPVHKWIILVDTLVSLVGFVVFEYYAVDTYLHLSPSVPLHVYFYWLNQIFALIFFLALYLSVKTLRGKFLAGRGE